MKPFLSRLCMPAVMAALSILPATLQAASRGEVASPSSFQPVMAAGANTPACHGSLVSCGHRAVAALIPPEGSSPRVVYNFTDESFSFDSGIDILLLSALTRQPSEQGSHMEWRWRLAYRKLGPDHYRLIQIGIQYRCGSGSWLKAPCRSTGHVPETVMSDFGASAIAEGGQGALADSKPHETQPAPAPATPLPEPSAVASRMQHTGRQAERRRAKKERLGLEGLDMYNKPEPQIQYRMPPTSPESMRHVRDFMPLSLGSANGQTTAPCEKPIDLCGQQVLEDVYAIDTYGKLSPEQVRYESFVYGDEDDGVVRAVYLVTLVDLADDIIEGERVRIGFVRKGSSWVPVSAGRQVRCRYGYARTEWRGETCSS